MLYSLARVAAWGWLTAVGPVQAATLHSIASLGLIQYGNEPRPDVRLELDLRWLSETRAAGNEKLPARELRLTSFLETGPLGDRGMDLDPLVLRIGSEKVGHFWLGRTHPLGESQSPRRTDALGARWAQNQSNALEPRVSGWVGAGWFKRAGPFQFFLAGSPIFLPSTGPRLDLSETEAASGSRFARLPPHSVWIQGARLPLRYRVETGDLRAIVLQGQGLASISVGGRWSAIQLVAWTGPDPEPEVDASGVIRVARGEASVIATAWPRFPRRNFGAVRWSAPDLPLEPDLQLVREWGSRVTTVSATVRPLRILEGGVLHTFKAAESGASLPESPSYREQLAWLELRHEIAPGGSWALTPSLRVEGHLTSGKEGAWVRPMVRFRPRPVIGIFAAANLIAGKDSSYFGQWRSLDSVTFGGAFEW